MRILHLYRPRLPGVRAQAVQVVHTCEALARRGHEVTLLADRAGHGGADEALAPRGPEVTLLADRGGPGGADEALAAFGLTRPPSFDLRIAPTAWPPGAGLWFRAQVLAWRGDVVYARAKRYVGLVPARIPVVLEAHEVDSELARERGEDPAATQALEARVLARCAGVVANCEGTMALLEATHTLPTVRRVIHNATRGDRVVVRSPAAEPLVGYTGSPRMYKGLATVFASLQGWPAGATLEMVGGAPAEAPAGVRSVAPVPYGELPGWLARYHALLLPLDDNLFGRALTSPLKLWDYLATGIPIVAADLPTVRAIAGDLPHYYRPGDASGLAEAVGRALAAGSSPARVRTWDERAGEVEGVLGEVCGGG